MFAWPALERRFTGDIRRHDLLDRPRDRPIRTAVGAAFLSWVVIVFAVGSTDRIFYRLGISYTAQIHFWRVGRVGASRSSSSSLPAAPAARCSAAARTRCGLAGHRHPPAARRRRGGGGRQPRPLRTTADRAGGRHGPRSRFRRLSATAPRGERPQALPATSSRTFRAGADLCAEPDAAQSQMSSSHREPRHLYSVPTCSPRARRPARSLRVEARGS